MDMKEDLSDYERGLFQATSNPQVDCYTVGCSGRRARTHCLLTEALSPRWADTSKAVQPVQRDLSVGNAPEGEGMDSLGKWVAQAQQVKDTQKI